MSAPGDRNRIRPHTASLEGIHLHASLEFNIRLARGPHGAPARHRFRLVNEPVNLLNLLPADAEHVLRDFALAQGEPAYRGAQVVQHLWRHPVGDFAQITTLPVSFRQRLAEHFSMPRLSVLARQHSRDGTQKFLFRLSDGQGIEAVAIPEENRTTLCISSQAGCALQCAFCATGRMGFQRNLDVWEIVAQVREMRLIESPVAVTNIVFMGMGEPLMNWRAVDAALTILNQPAGLGIGARHITVSTVGILPGIAALARRPEQFRLALSVHAPDDALRRELMPINVKYPLAELVAAASAFSRRVTFEYVMLGGVNDAAEHAAQLASLARRCGAFVNLIPLHAGGTQEFRATSPERIAHFAREVRRRGVEVAIRKSRGTDISAACGQLRVERLGRRMPVAANEDTHVEIA